jgi:hypothetical protein
VSEKNLAFGIKLEPTLPTPEEAAVMLIRAGYSFVPGEIDGSKSPSIEWNVSFQYTQRIIAHGIFPIFLALLFANGYHSTFF